MAKRSKKKLKDVKPASFRSLFRFSTKYEIFFLFIAVVCAIGVGMVLPISFFVMGDLLDSFYDYQRCVSATNNNCTLQNVIEFNNRVINRNQSANSTVSAIEYVDIEDIFVQFALKFTYAGLAAGFMGFFRCLIWGPVIKKQIQRIRINYFQSVLKQDMEWIDSTSMGEINVQISGDITNISEGINERLASFIQEMSTFLTSLIMGLVLGWRLALLLIAFIPFIILGGFITIKVKLLPYFQQNCMWPFLAEIKPLLLYLLHLYLTKVSMMYSTKERKAYSTAQNITHSVFSYIKVVAAYGNQQNEIERYDESLSSAEKIGIRLNAVNGMSRGYLKGIIFLILSVAIWFSWLLMVKLDPTFTSGRLYTVFFVLVVSALNLGKASPYLATLSLAKSSAAIVFETLDRVSKIDPELNYGITPNEVIGDISFKGVDFSYSTRNTKVLQNVNVEFQCGKSVAVVGPSGSGKTTLLLLMQRMYEPESGMVMLDGKDIREYNVSYLRDLISIVHQSPFLFNTTIRENIALGGEDVQDVDIFQAAEDANALKFIQSLPQKFETVVGEKGCMLSGGQQQRICLARALVRKPKILLLDQTTSALDTENESEILNNLKKDSSNRTTIFTTHRVNTIQNADAIIVMDKGEIVEVGPHDHLMQNKGVYFSLMSVIGNRENEKKTANKVLSEDKIEIHCQDEETESTTSNVTEDEDSSEANKGYLCSLLKMNRKESPFIFVGSLMCLVSGFTWPAYGFIVAMTVKYLSQKETMFEGVSLLCPILAGGFLLIFITTFFQELFFGISGQKLTRRIRKDLMSAILRNNVDWFDNKHNTASNLNTRLTKDAAELKTAVGSTIGVFIESLACIISGFAIAFIYSWKLTLVTILVMPILIVGNMIRGKVAMSRATKMKTNELESINLASQAIANIHTIASLGKQIWFLRQYADKIKVPISSQIHLTLLDSVMFGIMCFGFYVPQAICFRFAGFLLNNHQIGFHDIFIVFIVLQITATILGHLFINITDAMKGHSSATRVFDLLNAKPDIDVHQTGHKSEIKGDVTFQKCSFAYPCRPETNALNDFSVEISSGETLALIGQSGCGKSTTVQLLERFYDLNEGSIKIDGIDLKEYDLQYLRSCFGFVFQEPVLFEGSIYENISYGINSEKYTLEDVKHAAQIANIHDFILTLEKGYNTQIGTDGSQLSKGEKQRISVARALIRNPKVLILDEATSSLDNESERLVQAALDKACEGRTCIVIAHRLSTIRHANKIAVMHNGEVVESGNHEELMNIKAAYFALVSNVQTLS